MSGSTVIHKITNLKEFVDFAFSLKEMEEVKKGFPLPTSVIFTLEKRNHENLQKEIIKEKKLSTIELVDEFELNLYDINFKFLSK
jgi:hypothetical protein